MHTLFGWLKTKEKTDTRTKDTTVNSKTIHVNKKGESLNNPGISENRNDWSHDDWESISSIISESSEEDISAIGQEINEPVILKEKIESKDESEAEDDEWESSNWPSAPNYIPPLPNDSDIDIAMDSDIDDSVNDLVYSGIDGDHMDVDDEVKTEFH
ncbi:unnamed protein product, partial [marine sediment metagenome]